MEFRLRLPNSVHCRSQQCRDEGLTDHSTATRRARGEPIWEAWLKDAQSGVERLCGRSRRASPPGDAERSEAAPFT
jgi:hypothetical protein